MANRLRIDIINPEGILKSIYLARAGIATLLVLLTSSVTAQPIWSETQITSRVDDVFDVVLADLDGDGDLDVLAAGQSEATVVWAANDGEGNYGAPTVIVSDAAQVRALATGDLNGDGNVDIVGASYSHDFLFWAAGDGEGGFASPQLIGETPDEITGIAVADLSDDELPDIVVAGAGGAAVFLNLGGR
jgi:hypothetical protein